MKQELEQEQEQEQEQQQHRLRRKGIYLLPNLFTTVGLFFGFYAIVSALKGRFDQAAMAIFIAMIFDGLDGRIARMTNTSSAFGAEFDSLSDMVTFGVAPALVAYSWGLHPLGKVGWLIAFLYTAATALRLARFNTMVGKVSKRYFQGLPCPAAAAVIAGMVWTGNTDLNIAGSHVYIIVAIVTALMGILMVSNVPFYSFKELDFKGRVPFVMIIIALLICIAIALNPPAVLFLGFLIFTLSGPIMYIFGFGRVHRRKKQAKRPPKK
jgi:CDP-diacylglycerol--serine O-phosphatidyltransferase